MLDPLLLPIPPSYPPRKKRYPKPKRTEAVTAADDDVTTTTVPQAHRRRLLPRLVAVMIVEEGDGSASTVREKTARVANTEGIDRGLLLIDPNEESRTRNDRDVTKTS